MMHTLWPANAQSVAAAADAGDSPACEP